MERRSFFKMLGLGVAAVTVLPVLNKIAPEQPKAYKSYIAGKNAMLADPGLVETDPNTIAEYKRKRLEPPGWVSYKFHMTTTLPPNAAKRIKYIDAVKS